MVRFSDLWSAQSLKAGERGVWYHTDAASFVLDVRNGSQRAMAGKKDTAASSLAASMIRLLRQRRAHGDGDVPLTLEELSRLADPAASPKTVLAAVLPQRRAFGASALVARRDLAAPVALLEDLPSLAASPATLLYALKCNRTASNHAASPSELKTKLTGKLKKPFQDAVNCRLAEGVVPPGVGWVLIRNTRKLFLLSDLHSGINGPLARGDSTDRSELGAPYAVPRPAEDHVGPGISHAPAVATEAASIAAPASVSSLAFALAFDGAFARLDRQLGGHNFVSLVELRRSLAFARDSFDAGLRELRVAGRYTLSAAEGRHGLTAGEREAGLLENGTLFLYVSRKSP
jgi:hypothetical protein